MRRALLDMRPDRFEDIIALVALYRPGPMANIPTYCARKHGDEEPEYLHPILEPILSVLPGQLFASALARAKGLDPDEPAHLSKVTLAP